MFKKLKDSLGFKIVSLVAIIILFIVSVFAATGMLNTRELSDREDNAENKFYDYLEINVDEGYVLVDPSDAYNGLILSEFLKENSEELLLDYSDSEYGMYINDIGNIVPEGYLPKKDGNKLYKYVYYVAYKINDEYASVGVDSEIIDSSDKYKFYVDSYNTNEVLAEITVYDIGVKPPYLKEIYGMVQSIEFPSFVLDIYNDIDGLDLESGQKVQDVLSLLEFKVTSSSTGYSKFEYDSKTILVATEKVNGMLPFIPTVYRVEFNGDEFSLEYSKGIAEGKPSSEVVSYGSIGKYFIASEWNGTTSRSEAVFGE